MEKLDDIKKALMALSDSIHEYDMAYWCAGFRKEAMEEIEAISNIKEAVAMLKGMKETLEALLEEEEDAQERARILFLMEMVEEMEKSLQGLSSASKRLLKNLFFFCLIVAHIAAMNGAAKTGYIEF